jgi:hypothetical protein
MARLSTDEKDELLTMATDMGILVNSVVQRPGIR